MPLTSITAEEITAMLENHRDEIIAHAVEEAKSHITYKLRYEVTDKLAAVVKDWFQTEMIPEIRAALVESKPAILEAAVTAANVMSEELGLALVEQVRENLKHSYRRANILKAIFNE